MTQESPTFEPESPFSESQWQILFSLLDAIVPSIVVNDSAEPSDVNRALTISEDKFVAQYESLCKSLKHPPTADEFRQYLASRPLDDPRFKAVVKKTVAELPVGTRKQLGTVLSFLVTTVGSLISTWSFTPFTKQPLHIREAILQSWQDAWLPIWQTLARAFLLMAKAGWTLSNQQLKSLNDYDAADARASPPGPAVDFKFLQFEAGTETAVVETDVVIIGSGCGGGVCAKVLAEAGRSVLVVDKGYYFPPSQLPVPAEEQGSLYQSGLTTVDGATTILTAKCWGGGGTINWSVSLETPDFVRQEWAAEGLDFFTSKEYQDNLDRVCDFMGVSADHVRHNYRSNVLLEGAKKLGWEARTCPQNTGGAEHYCGHCGLGCRSGEKQGPAVSWLPAAQNAGARFIEGFDVSEILFDDSPSKKAVGILGTWTSRNPNGDVPSFGHPETQRKVQVKAKKVIVACGTLNSPLLLQRSNLKNPHIGKNAHLHPSATFIAAFDEDVRGWEGGILTSVVSEFKDLDGKGHGVLIEAGATVPHMTLSTTLWRGALQYKTDALKFRQMCHFVTIARDRDTGSITADPDDGRPAVAYTPSKFDRKHLLTGLIGIAKLCYVEGAISLFPFVPNIPPFESHKAVQSRSLEDPDFVEWLGYLERHELHPSGSFFALAHLMGSCRMSANSEKGVVDDGGKVWEAENLYIADASVFPSASGVNPMITTMAIADRIARSIDAGWS